MVMEWVPACPRAFGLGVGVGGGGGGAGVLSSLTREDKHLRNVGCMKEDMSVSSMIGAAC